VFSAFSFGKIIKTILPGSILAAALLLIAEGFWAIARPAEGFLLTQVPKDWITPFAAALIPVSLILGFFLNTLAWLTLNSRLRACCTAEIKEMAVYAPLRGQLTAVLSADLEKYFSGHGRTWQSVPFKTPPTLEYYYLPVVTLTNLNYLWESYFCWYEFDINSVAALIPFVISAAFLLLVKLSGSLLLCAGLILLLFFVFFALCKMLWRAAVKNLVSYEKNLMLLITGSLINGHPAASTDPPPPSGHKG
jgi:hypothetical protein